VHDFESVEVPFLFTDPIATTENIAANGADLIVTSDFWGPTADLVGRYPDTMFVIIDRYARGVTGLPNEVGVTYAIEEGAFMAGAAAALMTETGMVGYVGAGPVLDAVEPARAGFVAGVEYVDPGVGVFTINKGGGLSAEEAEQAAREAANHLFGLGVDVIFEYTAANAPGVFDAAFVHSEATSIRRWVIAGGDGNDRTAFVPPEQKSLVLQSVIRPTDGLVFASIDDYMRGTLQPGHTVRGLGDPGYMMTEGAPELARHRDELDAIETAIVSGSIDVPRVTSNQPLMPVDFVDEGAGRGLVTIDEDGQCAYSYEGPEPVLGVYLIFDIENQSGTVAYFGERSDDLSSSIFTVAFGVEVPPAESARFYYRLDDPNIAQIQLECAVDFEGPNHESTIVATFNPI
jgi:basic membrane protein A